MSYKPIARYYLVQNKQDITVDTPYFDWIGKNNLISSVRTELNPNWRIVYLNGKYGVVDLDTGKLVCDTLYNSIAVSYSLQFGAILSLKQVDENNVKYCKFFSVENQKMLFEIQCEEISEPRKLKDHFFICRNGLWGLYNIKTSTLDMECKFSLRELGDLVGDNTL